MPRNWWIFCICVIVVLIALVTHPVYMPLGHKRYFFWKSAYCDANPYIYIEPELQRMMIENSRTGRMDLNRNILAQMIKSKGVTLANDEVCTLDLKTWKITISKIKESKNE